MASPGVGTMRLKKELKMIYEEPPPGISAWPQEENMHELDAGVPAPTTTPTRLTNMLSARAHMPRSHHRRR